MKAQENFNGGNMSKDCLGM